MLKITLRHLAYKTLFSLAFILTLGTPLTVLAQAQDLPVVTPEARKAYQDFLATHPYTTRPHMNKAQLKAIPKKDRPDLAWEQDYLATMDPALRYPPKERLFPLFATISQMQGNPTPTVPGGAGSPWVERGPNNVGGRTRAIMFDPTDATSRRVYAAGVTGGLWFTNDITATNANWVNVGDFWDNIAVTALAYDPNNTSTWYAGTGEGWGAAASRGAGIWKTTNAGTTWTQLTASLNMEYVNDIVVRNETGTSVVYVASSRMFYEGTFHGVDGCFRSTNGGSSFTNTFPNSYSPADLEIAADGRIFAGTRDNVSGSGGGKIYYSDNGTSWTQSLSIAGAERVEVACAPSDLNYVYALVENGGILSGVRRSVNRGGSWSSRSEPNDADPGIPATDFTRGQGWYDLIIEVDPNNRDNVWAGGIDIFRSTDGAANWDQMTHWYGGFGFPEIHADQHAIVFKPGSSTEILFGTDGGVYRTANGLVTSPSFQNKNDDYNVTQFYACAIHPTAATNYFLAGAQDNGTQQFTGPGINATVEASGGDGAFCFIDQTNPSYQLTSFVYNSWRRSTNGGTSFADIQNNQSTGQFINPADYDDNQDILFSARTTSSIQRITSVTGSFNIDNFSVSLGSQTSHIRVSPYTTSSSTIFVGTTSGDVFKITNANGGSPSSSNITGASFPTGNVSCIELGANENEIVVTFSNYGVTSVWYTTNGGTSWVSKEGNLPDMPVRWALFNPNDRNEIILATEVGIWASVDFNLSSPTWSPSNSGLANVRVDMLQMRDSDFEVIAATYGRGLFSASAFSSLLPTANFTGTPTSGCTTPHNVQFTDLSNGSPSTWAWTFGDGGTSTAQNPLHTYIANGLYTVQLIVTNANGNDTLVRTNYIDVAQGTPLPIAEDFENLPYPATGWELFNPSANATWERTTAVSGFGSGTAAMLFDNFNNNVIGDQDEYRTPKMDFSATGNYQLTFDVAYARYGANDADTLNILVTTDCGTSWTNVYSKGSNTLATAPQVQTAFVPSSTEWRTETVSLAAFAGNPSVQVAFANGPDFGQNLYVDNINIAVTNAPPIAAFTGSPTSVCPGDNVTFTDNSGNAPTSWAWTFTGGTPATSTAQNPGAVTWAAPGMYSVQLIATNANGSDTLTQTNYVTINDCSPVAAFTENTTSGCPPLTVNYTDNSTNTPTSWAWSFPGGTPATSTAANPSVVYNTPGMYDVELIATNTYGSDTILSTNHISVTSCAPVAAFTASDSTGCPGLSVTFTDNSTNTPTGWTWSFPGGTPNSSTAASPTVVYNTAGSYDVTLTVTNASGNDMLTKTGYINVGSGQALPLVEDFEVLPFPGANWNIFNPDADATWIRTTSASGFGVGTATMAFDNFNDDVRGTIDEYRTPNLDFSAAGSYLLSFDVAYARYGALDADTLSIQVSSDCGVTWTEEYRKDPAVLATGPDFTAGIFIPAPSQWRKDTVDLSSYAGSGAVQVAFRNGPDFGQALFVDNINVFAPIAQPPTASFSGAPTTVCIGDVVTFTDQSAGATSWAWTFPGGTPATSTNQNPTVSWTTPGTYDITLIATNATGSDTLVQTNYITVTNTCNPVAAFTASDSTGCPGLSVTFTDNSLNNPTSWAWSFPGGTPSTSTATNPTIIYNTPGAYDVQLIVSNGSGSDTLVKTTYINIGTGQPLPLSEDFENLPFPGAGWTLYNPDADTTWERAITISGFGVGTACLVFDNLSQDVRGTVDEYRTPDLDFSTLANYTLNFDVAYARYDALNADTLTVHVSTDCGTTWIEEYRRDPAVLATAPDQTTTFIPTATQWRTETVNLSSYAGNAALQIAFRNGADYGQLLYVDNINVTTNANPPVADFIASDTLPVCEGTQITFTDQSTAATTWSWTFAGGTPSTSTQQNPVITYNTAGMYDVQLIASNGFGSDTLIKTAYINVGIGTPLPIVEDFEALPFPGTGWENYNPDGNVGWGRGTQASGYGVGAFSLFFNNFNFDERNFIRDEYRTPKMDFSGPGNYLCYFDVAYARYGANDADTLSVQVSTDCGTSWTEVYRKDPAQLATAADQTSGFIPLANQWRTDTINLTPYAGNGMVIVAFRNGPDYGQGLYVDNINITNSNPSPPVADFLANDTTVCAGDTVNYLDQSTGNPTSWAWTFPGGTPATSTDQNPVIVYNTAGTYDATLVATNGNGNDSFTRTSYITVSATPNTSAITGNNAVCSGETGITYSVTNTAGSSYAWSITGGTQASGGTSNSITVDWGAAGAGVVSVVETNSGGCDGSAVSLNVTINASPNTGAITGSGTVCANQTGVTYAVPNTAGSTYAWAITGGTQASGGTTNSISVDWGTAGAGTVQVTETATGGCVGTPVSLNVTINPAPSTSAITGNSSICANAQGEVYSVTNTATSFYAWSVTGGTQVAGGSSNSITVNWGAGPTGTIEVTEVGLNGCPGTPVTLNVSMNAGPTTSAITGSNSVCANTTGVSYSVSNTAGNTYTWTITGGTQASGGTTNSITVDWGAAGAGTVQVVEEDAGGCQGSPVTANVTIDAIPVSIPITGMDTVCSGAQGVTYTLPGGATSNYGWLILNGTQTSGGNSGTITVDWPAGPTQGNIFVQETTPAACSGPQIQLTVEILGPPATSAISGMTTVCTNQAGVTYSVTNTPGSSYAWNITGGTQVTGGTSNSITVDWGGGATGTVEVVETNSFGCVGTAVSQTITITNSANTSPITGSAAVCSGDTGVTYSVVNSAGSNYAWTVTGGTQTSGGTTNSITVDWGVAGAGVVQVVETASGGCSGNPVILNVTVSNAPSTSAITGSALVCENETGVTYSVTNTAGSSYVWNITGGTQASGGTTASITIDWGAAGAGTVEVTETNGGGCAGTAVNLSVAISPAPVTSNITGTDTVCAGQTAIGYSVVNTTGSTYTWTITGGTQASGGTTNSITVDWAAAGAGSVSVVETNLANCPGAAITLPVVINPIPATGAISGDTAVCENEAGVIYTVANTIGSTYAWAIVGGTQTAGTNTNSITVDWGTAGTGSVTVTETGTGGCVGSPVSVSVNINAAPITSTILGPITVCANSTNQTYSVTNTFGSSYSWTITGGTQSSGGTSPSIAVNWGSGTTGSVQVVETDINGCVGAPVTIQVTLSAPPNTSAITGANSVCAFDLASGYSVVNTPGATYTWTVSGGVLSSGQGTNIITVDWGTTGAGSVQVVESFGTGCSGTPVTISVTINGTPTTSGITGPNQVCENDVSSYSVTNTPGSLYAWTITGGTQSSGGTSSAITVDWGTAGPGSVQVVETSLDGCEGVPVTLNITIDVIPTASFTGPTVVDLSAPTNGFATFNNTSTGAGTNIWTFGDGGGSNIASPTYQYTSTGTYTVTLVASNGVCTDTATQIVEVIQSVGIEEEINFGSIDLYPNPTQGDVNLTFGLDATRDIKVEVFNVLGVRVIDTAEENVREGTYTYQIGEHTAGVYFVKVSGADFEWIRKVMLVR